MTPREESLKGFVEDQNLVLISSTAIRLEKQLKTDKKRHRTGQVAPRIIKQKNTIINYQQRLLEKQKTKQKKERRVAQQIAA